LPGEQIFAVNTLAPYVLTCLMQKAEAACVSQFADA
jgi:hypothetical protein